MNENRAMSKTESSDASAGQDAKPEPSNGSFAEKHPNLTLLESGQNPGEILRAAREKAGYSLSDISAQTKINERQLEAIESGDVGRLPPETFAKAFIKSYCKALKMDPAPVIMSFGFSEASAQVKAARSGQAESGRSEPLEPKMPNSSKRLSTLNFDRKTGKKSLSYGIVLAAVVVMAVFYIPVFMSSQTTEVGDAEVIEPNEAPVATAPGSESAVSADGSLPLGLEAPAAAGDTAVFPALQQPAEPVGESAPPATAAPNATGAASTTAAAPVADAAAPAVAPLAPNVESVLRFNFQEQSWVTVRDANDKVLISQLNDGGSNLEVKGQAPFKLIVGNAKAVSVSSNGKSVDLTSSIRGEVARITVQ
ncbi:helix-turn-helix domain-containing protein [Limnobacter profundi]|uniref:Helix-turn-helix domain-containing protein n=1 Tax=Limnobacter profundi TaxID=2732163 RepID=A0ABX6N786_9BURK|nr:RodZ domain-containing protein [Limnobacter sp. SAORIC-580]QJR29447.1 helix-turn-helix domain-containing protein [Limnobacter sp. SAORIC-580]